MHRNSTEKERTSAGFVFYLGVACFVSVSETEWEVDAVGRAVAPLPSVLGGCRALSPSGGCSSCGITAASTFLSQGVQQLSFEISAPMLQHPAVTSTSVCLPKI